MKLIRALKEKNRLAGEVNQLFTVLSRENSREEKSTSKVDAEKIYKDWLDKKQKLSALKASIAKANVDIYEKISQMEELKSEITSLDMLDTKDGTFQESLGYRGDKVLEKVYKAYITNEKRDALKIVIQEKINKLQDEIDEYNIGKDVILE